MKRIPITLICILALSSAVASFAQREPSEDEKEKARIKIGLTREQHNQIEAIFSDARRQENEIHTKSREQYGLLFSLYENYDFDRDQAKKVRREIGKLNYNRMLIYSDTQEKLRRILSREQFDKMTQHGREMREEWRKKSTRRRGSGEQRP